MATDAYTTFENNIFRAQALVRIYQAGTLQPKPGDKRGQGTTGAEERQMLPAAVVLAIGTLDAYLADVAAEIGARLVSSGHEPTDAARKALNQITKENPGIAVEIALLPDATDKTARAQKALLEYFTGQRSGTNHGIPGVELALARMGLASGPFWTAADSKVPAKLAKRVGGKSAKKVLTEWTDLRHAYVHRGADTSVRLQEVIDLGKFIKALAQALDSRAEALLCH